MTTIAKLSGDTYRFRDRLRAAGWRWNPAGKVWEMQVDVASSPDQVLGRVRSIDGIRNRGDLTVEIV